MHLVIDYSGHQVVTLEINDPVARPCRYIRGYQADPLILNKEIGYEYPSFIDDGGIFYDCSAHSESERKIPATAGIRVRT